MWCHELLHVKDVVWRDSGDDEAGKTYDASYVDFSMDPPNTRITLSTNNFEQLRHGANHRILPVTLVVYASLMDVSEVTLLYHSIVDLGCCISR